MTVRRKLDTPENREFWEGVDRAEEAAKWPDWKIDKTRTADKDQMSEDD